MTDLVLYPVIRCHKQITFKNSDYDALKKTRGEE